MEKSATQLPLKLLINAEEFGFGPTAAIADFFPYLRERFSHIAYVGSGHSLDLQRAFDYDAFYDHFDEQILEDYDLFFTALDFEKAERAVAIGKPTIIYDPLCWYWPEMPKVVSQNVLYLAQAFHGVEERLILEKEKFSNPIIVKPITIYPKKSLVLLNMGGIQNPYWSLETCLEYARNIIRAFKENVRPDEETIILSSSKIADALPDVQSMTREEVLNLLPNVKYAIQTPGLSNIYDVSAMNIPTLYLPPANDSQGQQLELIVQHQQADAYIDWKDISSDLTIDYHAGQQEVFAAIEQNIQQFQNKKIYEQFVHLFQNSLTKLSRSLIDQYGSGGAQEVVDHIVTYAEKEVLSIV